MASLQAGLVALFMFSGVPIYYTFVTGWSRFSRIGENLQNELFLTLGLFRTSSGGDSFSDNIREESTVPGEAEPLLRS